MNDDARRWIDLEGPPPSFIQEILDAVRESEPITREESEAMDRRFFEALAEQRRQAKRKRRATRGLMLAAGAVAAAGVAAVVAAAVALHHDAPAGDAALLRVELPPSPSPAGGPDAGAAATATSPSSKPVRRAGARR